MKKIYALRRTGLLLVVFGFGLLVGGNASQWSQALYIVGVVMWLLIYDLAMEGRENRK
ncbi:hypothetical protein V6C12_00320 [Enterococcus faecalis]|uniref:hypothetical protein n=1 Tax=Enterococcus faecalis TaxID=1351 RepID=UPI0030CB4BAC